MSEPHELQALREVATLVEDTRTILNDAIAKRDAAILAAHANHAILMPDLYAASRISQAAVQKILARENAPHRPKYRPARKATA